MKSLTAMISMAPMESNIANASNPNYSAELVGFQTTSASNGSGDGVEVLQTQRAEAPLLTQQIDGSQATES
jgi:flagellar hook-associated protein FlgK